jgi:hypothetical protein
MTSTLSPASRAFSVVAKFSIAYLSLIATRAPGPVVGRVSKIFIEMCTCAMVRGFNILVTVPPLAAFL